MLFAKHFHVEVTVGFDPILMDFDRQRPDESQHALLAGKDANDMFDLLIEPLKHIGDRRHIRRQTESRLHDMTNPIQHSEGTVARLIEEQTAKLPSDVFLWAAAGTILLSLTLKISGQDHRALFVGQWAPTLLILGLYNKLVKQLGSDRLENSVSKDQ